MNKVFIAGSRKISRLNETLYERLENIIKKDYLVLVGDANGADKAIQKYLKDKHYNNVRIFCSGYKCRNNIGDWNVENVDVPNNVSGLKFYMEKDKKMAENADYGFMLWDGQSAGTLSNVLELLKRDKKVLVYFSPEKSFIKISNISDVHSLIEKCDKESIEKINKKININSSIKEINSNSQIQLSI